MFPEEIAPLSSVPIASGPVMPQSVLGRNLVDAKQTHSTGQTHVLPNGKRPNTGEVVTYKGEFEFLGNWSLWGREGEEREAIIIAPKGN